MLKTGITSFVPAIAKLIRSLRLDNFQKSGTEELFAPFTKNVTHTNVTITEVFWVRFLTVYCKSYFEI
jgi:hypothetical protein